ncbi:MAG: hypothetical protein ABFC24_07830 [Methanoregulaceae archaeon]
MALIKKHSWASVNRTLGKETTMVPEKRAPASKRDLRGIRGIPVLLSFFLIAACIGSVAAITTDASSAAAAKVYVKDVTWDPAVFYPGDTGTVTFNVTNGNTAANSTDGVIVNHATISANEFRVTGGKYETSTNIGPGQTRTFSFSVIAPDVEGTYYPTFSLTYVGADSLWYTAMIKVEASPLEITVKDKPDTFQKDRKDSVSVAVSNPRQNTVKNVVLSVSGDGVTANPDKTFIGSIGSGQTVTTNVSVTPTKETPLYLNVTYDNGDNQHSVSTQIPLVFDTDKKIAEPIASNIKIKYANGTYDVTGDVTNAGLTTANSVVVTTGSPAVPTNPYQSYVVGTLKSDDFASFEVTFGTNGATTVPLLVTYKDTDGNQFTSSMNINLAGADAVTSDLGSGTFVLAGVGIIVILGIIGFLYYRKRKPEA